MKQLTILLCLALAQVAGAACPLKQSTAGQVIEFGPAVDETDGVTLQTGLVSAFDNATTGIMLSKNGGTLAVRNATVTATTYDAHGTYKVTLDATDTNTLGRLRIIYTDAATLLPIWEDCEVMPANIYDSIYGADTLNADVILVEGSDATTYLETLDDPLLALTGALVTGTCDSGSTTTCVDAARTEAVANHWTDQCFLPTNGSVIGQTRVISAFDEATDTITFTPALTASMGTSTYEILPCARVVLAALTHTGAVVPTVTTATNLTNAPTAGDFTATMKLSINTEADLALADYDGPTLAETQTECASPTEVGTELATYGGPTLAETQTACASPTEVATELGTYDGPTKAELDTAVALLAELTLDSGTAQAGSASTIQLRAAAPATSQLVGKTVLTTGGTGAGQSSTIIAYNTTTKSATVLPHWRGAAPDATTTYRVLELGVR